jgi:hypothetical protein
MSTSSYPACASPKKSSKKAAKSAKKVAKLQIQTVALQNAAAEAALLRRMDHLENWAGVTFTFALKQEALRFALLQDWKLLSWLEVRAPAGCQPCLVPMQHACCLTAPLPASQLLM